MFNKKEKSNVYCEWLKVSLSETSLDVFQLLLQLSDTMLELNNQLSSSTNAQQLIALNSSSSQFNLASITVPHSPSVDQDTLLLSTATSTINPTTPTVTKQTRTNVIEDFLQKTFYPATTASVNSSSAQPLPPPSHQKCTSPITTQPSTGVNSISSIIKSINSRSSSNSGSGQETRSSTGTKRTSKPVVCENVIFRDDETTTTTIAAAANVGDNSKNHTSNSSSVMQFVDQLLNGTGRVSLLTTVETAATADNVDEAGTPSPTEHKLGGLMLSASTSLSSNIDCSSLSSSSAASQPAVVSQSSVRAPHKRVHLLVVSCLSLFKNILLYCIIFFEAVNNNVNNKSDPVTSTA